MAAKTQGVHTRHRGPGLALWYETSWRSITGDLKRDTEVMRASHLPLQMEGGRRTYWLAGAKCRAPGSPTTALPGPPSQCRPKLIPRAGLLPQAERLANKGLLASEVWLSNRIRVGMFPVPFGPRNEPQGGREEEQKLTQVARSSPSLFPPELHPHPSSETPSRALSPFLRAARTGGHDGLGELWRLAQRFPPKV